MILLSVGTQLPFDRLVRTVDHWARDQGRTDVVAQIGVTRYRPVALRHFAHLGYDEFRELQRQCTLMVCHAGMGSIITAMEFGKPIIVMPRDHRLREHRNGHQYATLRQFGGRPGIYPAENEKELTSLLDRTDMLTATPTAGTHADAGFVEQLAHIVNQPVGSPLLRRIRRFF
ncbi:glycosyltransferase [Sphingomonas sp. 3-13AW]|uniref:glycosyltransferase n=1 Tax=Sphingomonas sp. 3-13AW TaxID=3050450 RepID=UPI003BB7236A